MNRFNGEQGKKMKHKPLLPAQAIGNKCLFPGIPVFLFVLLLLPVLLSPQSFEEYRFKSYFFQTIARSVEWPEEAGLDDPTKPFVIAVYGENPFGTQLDEDYAGRRGRRIKGKKVEIRYPEKIEKIPGCHILFISGLSRKNLMKVLEFTGNKPILTIGETSGYAQRGVHIRISIKNDKPYLEINETAAREANLLLSSSLLNPSANAADRIEIINPYIPSRAKALQIGEFIPFITWPPGSGMDDPSKPFNITVIGTNPFESYLEDIFKKKRIMNKRVNIRNISSVNQIGDTQLLFVSKSMKNELAKILDYTRNKPILTIGDSEGFASQGIHINMFYDRAKLRLEINNEAARQAKIDISPQLLKQARRIASFSNNKQ
jgi:hypothetical protein